jgi:hypothetical protein
MIAAGPDAAIHPATAMRRRLLDAPVIWDKHAAIATRRLHAVKRIAVLAHDPLPIVQVLPMQVNVSDPSGRYDGSERSR